MIPFWVSYSFLTWIHWSVFTCSLQTSENLLAFIYLVLCLVNSSCFILLKLAAFSGPNFFPNSQTSQTLSRQLREVSGFYLGLLYLRFSLGSLLPVSCGNHRAYRICFSLGDDYLSLLMFSILKTVVSYVLSGFSAVSEVRVNSVPVNL